MIDVEGHLAGLSLEDAEEEEVCQLENSSTFVEDSLMNCFVGCF